MGSQTIKSDKESSLKHTNTNLQKGKCITLSIALDTFESKNLQNRGVIV